MAKTWRLTMRWTTTPRESRACPLWATRALVLLSSPSRTCNPFANMDIDDQDHVIDPSLGQQSFADVGDNDQPYAIDPFLNQSDLDAEHERIRSAD